MRRNVDLVEARSSETESPEQFWWRGRQWQVRDVVSDWRETGAWWEPRPEDDPGGSTLTTERRVWRVRASQGPDVAGLGIFDLTFDGSAGGWRLARTSD